MGFSSQQHWNGLPFPSPGDLPNPGIKLASLASPALAGSFFTTSATWESQSAPLPILITSSYYIRHLNNIPSDINLTGDFAFSVKNLKNKNTSEAKRIFGNDDFSKKKKRVQFSRSVVPDSLQPHESQYAMPPCPSPTPGVHPKPCPLSRWCHPTISSFAVPFSSCPQSFPASGFLQISQLFTSGSQSIGVSALASVLPMNTQDWSPLGWTGWISLQSKELSRRIFSNTTDQKLQFFCSAFFTVQLSHPYISLEILVIILGVIKKSNS